MKMQKYRELVEDFYGVDLGLKCRKTIYIEARAIYYYLCRNLGHYSLNKIAKSLDKTHATVLHSLAELPYMRKFNSKLDENFYELYEIAENLNKEKPEELTLEQLVQKYNKLQIDYQVIKYRLLKYENVI
jgi:hypothetical protein